MSKGHRVGDVLSALCGLGADFYQRNADLTRLEEHRLACVCAWITMIGVRVRQAEEWQRTNANREMFGWRAFDDPSGIRNSEQNFNRLDRESRHLGSVERCRVYGICAGSGRLGNCLGGSKNRSMDRYRNLMQCARDRAGNVWPGAVPADTPVCARFNRRCPYMSGPF